ncbi:hypothetical protein [Lysobacter sp. ESA13C]|uniref:hypothetical protein n=1 Tax=Lysobacter sp. ESA13C TaxID=2862676 RepID=UPI001CBAFFE9|nr:hypothetical protein [Lysobacter sp. ESA13C]
MNVKALASSAASLFLLASCAIYPVVPRWSTKQIDDAAKTDPYLATSPTEALVKVRGVRSLLASAADNRKRTELVASEVTYYGSLIGVVGLSLDKQGLINTGGASAGLGTLFAGRYRLGEQATAFRKAEERVACMEAALTATQFWDSVAVTRKFVSASAFSGMHAAFSADPASLAILAAIAAHNAEIPAVTSSALRRVANDLRIALSGLALTPLTKEQMKKVIDDAINQKSDAENELSGMVGAPSSNAESLISAAAATLTYKEQVAACFVEYPQ